MKYIVIILTIALIIVGIKSFQHEVKFYPEGDVGNRVPYFTDFNMAECNLCGLKSTLFKIDSRQRKICPKCYKQFRYK